MQIAAEKVRFIRFKRQLHLIRRDQYANGNTDNKILTVRILEDCDLNLIHEGVPLNKVL